MFAITSSNRFFLYSQPTDMRKSFDGLCGLVRSKMGQDPMSGDVYIFIGTRKDAIKLLHWEQGGFVLYYKRLEQGTFDLPQNNQESPSKPVSWASLVLLIEGIRVEKYRQKPRFKPG
jgi:transposase